MELATLKAAMGNDIISDEECAVFNAAMVRAGCISVNRSAMFAAQMGHESVGLRYYREIASGAAYEGRTDLGNTHPGDGVRYAGRGIIQLTGRSNYTAFSKWAAAQGIVSSPTYFVDNPAQLERVQYGAYAASWYWTIARPQINSLCDQRDLEGVTRAINGGLNGIDDRRTRWNRCLALGAAILPTEGDTMSYADDELKKQFPSRSKYRTSDKPIDTLAGFVLNVDARLHEEFVEREALKGVDWCVDLIKREAAKGDVGAQAIVNQIEGK